MQTRTLIIVTAMLATVVAIARGAPPASVATSDSLRVTCAHVGGTVGSGQLVQLDSEKGASIITGEDQSPKRIPLTDMVRIRAWTQRKNAPAGALVFTLSGQDRVVGRVTESDGETLIVETGHLGAISIDLLDVARIEQPSCKNPLPGDGHLRPDTPPSAHDRVRLCNGTMLTGFVNNVQPAAIRLEVAGQSRSIPMDRIQSIALAGLRTEPRKPKELRAVIEFTDGTRLTAADLDWPGRGPLTLRYDDRQLTAAAQQLASITIVGGRHVPLTELTPILAEHVPLIRTPWPHRVNQSVAGSSLRVGGQSFESGIGVHSRSRLVFDLAGDYEHFTTRFGIDDSAGPLADAEVVIFTDGTERYRERIRHGDGLHSPVRIDVTGAHRLELRVEFGANGAIQDRINWIEPALVRPAGAVAQNQ